MLTKAEDLAFNVSLEVLAGCGYSCAGCGIDKNATSEVIEPDDVPMLLRLVDDFNDKGYRLHELTLGPTDIVASKTGLNVFDHPLILEMSKRYASVTVSLAMLFDTGIVELAVKVERLMPGKKLRVIVPLTLKNAHNEKFMDGVRRRLDLLQAHLNAVELKLVYLSINVIDASAQQFSFDANLYVNSIDLGVPTLVEYIFPHSRKGFDNLLVREAFKHDFASYIEAIHAGNNTHLNRYLIPTPSDSREVTYRAGKLYYTPVLMEKFPIFTDDLVIPKPWDAHCLEECLSTTYYNALLEYSDHPTCGDCCFLDNCARGDMHVIMKQLGREDCIINMQNRWDLAPSTDPVRRDD